MQSRAKTPLKVHVTGVLARERSILTLSTELPAGGASSRSGCVRNWEESSQKRELLSLLNPTCAMGLQEKEGGRDSAGIADSLKLRYTFILAGTN